MAHIQLHDVCVDLPVFGAHSRSLKNRIISAATGLPAEKAEAAVFEAGIARATAPCVELIAFLINPEGEQQGEATGSGNP